LNLDEIIKDITDGLEDVVEPDIFAEVDLILRDVFEGVWRDRREVGGLYIYGLDTSLDVDVQETFMWTEQWHPFDGSCTEKVNWKKEGF